MTDKTNPKDIQGMTKPPLSLFPGTAIVEGSMVMKDGVQKYGLYNWRDTKIQSLVYLDAALRHIYAYIDGEDVAEDSGRSHLAHAMMTIAILIDAKANNGLIDTRPKSKGTTSEVLKNNTLTNTKVNDQSINPIGFHSNNYSYGVTGYKTNFNPHDFDGDSQ